MRAKEFISEDHTKAIDVKVSDSLPATFVLPDLKNQDPYLQYRFGLALASVRANAEREADFKDESEFGENMVVVARSAEEEETLRMALAMFGKDNSISQIADSTSRESADTNTQSPIQPQPRVSRKS